MGINTLYKVKLSRDCNEEPLTVWAKDINLLARISIALNCKKPAIAVEEYEVKQRRKKA